jgi:hypothetical protein
MIPQYAVLITRIISNRCSPEELFLYVKLQNKGEFGKWNINAMSKRTGFTKEKTEEIQQSLIQKGFLQIENGNYVLPDTLSESIQKYTSKKDKERKFPCFKTPPPPPSKSGYVYLLRDDNMFKIGKAKCFTSRLETYETENPRPLTVVHSAFVSNYSQVEKELLTKFKQKRHRGEWFVNFNKDDIDKFSKITDRHAIGENADD